MDSAVHRVLNKYGPDVDILRTIPESKWNEDDAMSVVQHGTFCDISRCVPTKLQTSRVWLAAFTEHPQLYQNDIPDKIATYDFYLEACRQKPLIHQCVPIKWRTTQLYTICMQGLMSDYRLRSELQKFLRFVPAECQTPELVEQIITKEPSNLEFVANQTTEMCMMALKKHPPYLWMIREQTPNVCMYALRCALTDDLINMRMRLEAIFPETIRSIRVQDDDFCIMALKQLHWRAASDFLKHIREQTRSVCAVAYNIDRNCIDAIRSANTRRWIMRNVIARRIALPLLEVGLSVSLQVEIYEPLHEFLFPVKTCFAERKLSSVQLWELLARIKHIAP